MILTINLLKDQLEDIKNPLQDKDSHLVKMIIKELLRDMECQANPLEDKEALDHVMKLSLLILNNQLSCSINKILEM
jgi:hypothetical protein